MRHTTRSHVTALLAGLVLAGCDGSERQATRGGDTMTATGEVSPGGTVGSMGALVDSEATAAGEVGDVADLSTLGEADVMALIGASNAAEIATGRVAREKALDADVRAFARRMVSEHQAMQSDADELATRIGVSPGSPARAVRKTRRAGEAADRLRAATADEAFDRQYIDGVVLAHEETLAELQAMQGTANAGLRTLIQRAIPKVQAHLRDARQLQGRHARTSAAR